MKRVLERLMDTVVTVDDDDEEEEEEAKHSQHHGSVHCSLGTLCDWYSSQTKVRLVFMTRSRLHQRGPITVTMDMFSNYRNPAVAHLEKSAALLAEMVNSNLRL